MRNLLLALLLAPSVAAAMTIIIDGERYEVETEGEIVIDTQRPDSEPDTGGSDPDPAPDPEPEPDPEPAEGIVANIDMRQSLSRSVYETTGTDVFRFRTSEGGHYGAFATSAVDDKGRRLWISETRGGEPIRHQCDSGESPARSFRMWVLLRNRGFGCVLEPDSTYYVHVEAMNPPHTYRLQYDHYTE